MREYYYANKAVADARDVISAENRRVQMDAKRLAERTLGDPRKASPDARAFVSDVAKTIASL